MKSQFGPGEIINNIIQKDQLTSDRKTNFKKEIVIETKFHNNGTVVLYRQTYDYSLFLIRARFSCRQLRTAGKMGTEDLILRRMF